MQIDICDVCWRDRRTAMPYADGNDVAKYCDVPVATVVTDHHGVSWVCQQHLDEYSRYGPLDVIPLTDRTA